jgi:plasmid maintenance system antidote protein VapI
MQWRNLPVAKTDKLDPPQAPVIALKAEAHPGPLIRDKLKAVGFSIPAAAVVIGMNRANLNNVLLGKAALSHDMAYRLNMLINPNDDEFELSKLMLGIQSQYEWAKTAGLRNVAKAVVGAGRKYGEIVERGETGHLHLTKAGLMQKLKDEAEMGVGNSPLG